MAEHFIGNILSDDEKTQQQQEIIQHQLRTLALKRPESKLILDNRRSGLAMFRSSSAPPEQLSEAVEPTTPLSSENEKFRADPAYYHFYISQRNLNPRLPPPVIGPHWDSDVDEVSFNKKHQTLERSNGNNVEWGSPDSKGKRTSVVDRIQEDFPRTPSPVYRESTKRFPAAPGNNTFLFGAQQHEESDAYMDRYAQQQQHQIQSPSTTLNYASAAAANVSSPQPQQQSITPMFFPGSSTEDLLSQHVSNLSVHLHDNKNKSVKKPSTDNYYRQQMHPTNRETQNQPSYVSSPPQGMMSQGVPPTYIPYYGPTQNLSYGQQSMNHYAATQSHPSQYGNVTANHPVTHSHPFPAQAVGGRGAIIPQTNHQYIGKYGTVAGSYYSPTEQASPWNQMQQSATPTDAPSLTEKDVHTIGYQSNGSNLRNPNRHIGKQSKATSIEQIADYNQAPRSKLMEEFKSGRGRKFELKDIVGNVVEFSRDQHGSRFIQQKLESATSEEKELIFKEISPHALKLMTDVFGNYVIQKFFEFGLPSHKKTLVRSLKTHVLELSLQTYGCRVIQKALEVIDDEDKRVLALELDGYVMRCVQDQNGNHVIQKCIERIPAHMVQFIVDAFQGNIVSQAVHAYGCRVIQRILEHCNEQQTQQVLDEILVNVHKLVKDQYGNYVVQHVLEHGREKHKSAIIKSLKGNILQLSYNKYASNVIEKCFQYGNKKERNDIIDEIIGKGSNKDIVQSPLFEMMKDKFANYVIQKMIEMSDENQRRIIFEVMKPHTQLIRKLAYGKHIIAVVEKYYPGGFQ